jgi:hypothetical protein
MVLVAITGLMGSGKDTAAAIFLKNGFVRRSFAEPLKEIGIIFGFTQSQIYGTQEDKLEINKEWGVSGRHFLQKFGTEVGRDYLPQAIPDMKMNDQTIWIRLMDIYCNQHPEEDIVITDLRFHDEAKMVKARGGKIIKIERPSSDKDTGQHTLHASERDIPDIEADYTIVNDGTLDEFLNMVTKVYYMIEGC